MNTLGFQVMAAVTIFVEMIICGLAPLWVMKKFGAYSEKRDRILSIANAFSGGIFLSSGFVHLLAESQDTLSHEIKTDFPVAILLCCASFYFVFFIEKIVFSGVHSHNYFVALHEADDLEKNLLKEGNDYGTTKSTTPPITNSEHCSPNNSPSTPRLDADRKSNTEHVHIHPAPALGSYVLFLVLSFHTVTSSLALGVQESITNALPFYLAIVSHKWVEAFAVGVNMIRLKTPVTRTILYVFVYSLMTPIGITIGVIITIFVNDPETGVIIEAIGSAIAAGIFIYVATIDIMMEEFEKGKDKYLKMLVCLFGFAMLTGLLLILPHEHEDHSH